MRLELRACFSIAFVAIKRCVYIYFSCRHLALATTPPLAVIRGGLILRCAFGTSLYRSPAKCVHPLSLDEVGLESSLVSQIYIIA